MHFPPYHRNKSWQYFFVGIFVGSLIGYLVLLYMYGTMYEELLSRNFQLQEEIIDLREQNDVLLESQEERSGEPTVDEIDIIISNPELMKDDSLIVSQLKTLIKEEISHLIGTEIEIISSSDELLISSIENKAFTLDDMTYHFTITRLTIAPKMKLVVTASILN